MSNLSFVMKRHAVVLSVIVFYLLNHVFALPAADHGFFELGNNRMIGGENTTIDEHPYMVSLQYFGNHMCGASILGREWILTAAHCFGATDPLMQFLTIRAGTSVHNRDGVQHPVERIIRHENFTVAYDYDVALLKLKEPLIYSDTIKPIDIPEEDYETEPGSDGIVVGWGRTKTDDYLSAQLQEVTLSIVSYEDCRRLYGDELTPNMICAHAGSKDSCNGDSGGPLIVDGRQVGIVSWGPDECADPVYPGVYSKVSSFRNWIKNHTQ